MDLMMNVRESLVRVWLQLPSGSRCPTKTVSILFVRFSAFLSLLGRLVRLHNQQKTLTQRKNGVDGVMMRGR